MLQQPVIILKEWKSVSGCHTAYDRIVSDSFLFDYEVPPGVVRYEFLGMKPGTVKDNSITHGRTLEGEVVQRGTPVLVGQFMRTQAYLNSQTEEQAWVLAQNFYNESMCGVCVHPDNTISEVRGKEFICDPDTQGYLDINQMLARHELKMD